jgi:hypothetical protein
VDGVTVRKILQKQGVETFVEEVRRDLSTAPRKIVLSQKLDVLPGSGEMRQGISLGRTPCGPTRRTYESN